MKAILFREDGYNTANFMFSALARLFAQNCSRGYARHEGLEPPPYCNAMYLVVSLCILLRRQFTNPRARGDSRLTIILICKRPLSPGDGKKRTGSKQKWANMDSLAARVKSSPQFRASRSHIEHSADAFSISRCLQLRMRARVWQKYF